MLLALVIVAVACATNWWSRFTATTRVELLTKPTATVAIGALALVAGRHEPASIIALAMVAFAFCLSGDIALLPVIDRFVIGLGAFLLAHVAFVAIFIDMGVHHGGFGVIAAVAMASLAVIVGRPIVGGARAENEKLAIAVMAYLAVIGAMAVAAATTGRASAMVGATFFVASDSLLGWNRFVHAHRWMSNAVMVTYHFGLIGLALSLR